MYVAECPEVGTFSQGRTIEQAVNNLKEATELYLEEFPQGKLSSKFSATDLDSKSVVVLEVMSDCQK